MKIYDQCPQEVHDRVQRLIALYHKDLHTVDLKVDLLFASCDGEGDAVTHGGYAAYAVVRITNPKERAMGRGDAEIVIDRDKYNDMSEGRRDALLDHELYHLKVKSKDGAFQWDDHHRPKLAIRLHDVQVGWFAEVARRHGDFSVERDQGMKLRAKYGQTFFGFHDGFDGEGVTFSIHHSSGSEPDGDRDSEG